MGRTNLPRKSILTGAMVVLLLSCAQTQNITDQPPEVYSSELRSDQYAREIARLEKFVLDGAHLSSRKMAYFELAQLYSSYKNPKRNYSKALKNLQIYASLEPHFNSQTDARNWLSALQEINRLEKKITQRDWKIKRLNTKLKKSGEEKLFLEKGNQKLARNNRQLKNSNVKLQRKLEMLNTLDQRLEEKRKSFIE